ncbi:MAG: GntR family transcriptional regulator [Alphaproteobacteria bacterium]
MTVEAQEQITIDALGKRLSLVDEAYTQLKEKILNNQFPPGYQALEQEIARQLGMSRTPVREALIRLADDGLIEVLPRRGVRILPVSPGDMREIYQLLACLESMAAHMVALRGLGAGSEELQRMTALCAAMDAALAQDELENWAAADDEFHMLLLDSCGNKRLAKAARAVWDQSHRVRMVTLRLRPKPNDANKDHSDLVEAIRNCDECAAHEIQQRHRIEEMETVLGVLDRYRLYHL